MKSPIENVIPKPGAVQPGEILKAATLGITACNAIRQNFKLSHYSERGSL